MDGGNPAADAEGVGSGGDCEQSEMGSLGDGTIGKLGGAKENLCLVSANLLRGVAAGGGQVHAGRAPRISPRHSDLRCKLAASHHALGGGNPSLDSGTGRKLGTATRVKQYGIGIVIEESGSPST